MFNTYDEIEEIILGMADIVQENRLLRKRVEELEEKICQYEKCSFESYKEAQKETADLLKAFIKSNISVDTGVSKTFEMVGNYEQGGYVCPKCGKLNNPYFFKGVCEKCGFEDLNKAKYR